jgi:hypothetical protein
MQNYLKKSTSISFENYLLYDIIVLENLQKEVYDDKEKRNYYLFSQQKNCQ